MTVLNEQKLAFRDMTKEERSEIVEALLSGNAEYWNSKEWCAETTSDIYIASVYRARPRQLFIPWEVIKPEYKWAAMNKNGKVYLFPREPSIFRDDSFWDCGGERQLSVLDIDTVGIQWENSKTQRPEVV